MSKNLGTQLQDYATGTAKGCQHPIKDVDDNDYCHACNTQLNLKAIDKDAVIAARDAEIAALRGALEKSDPWKCISTELDEYECIHCGRRYDMLVPEIYGHADNCIWLESSRLLTPATPQARTVPEGGEREGR